MLDESFENINRDRTLRAIIENEHWTSAEDPTGFVNYTLYIIDFESGVVARDHMQDTLDGCILMADRDYGFEANHWKKRSERVVWPDRPPLLTRFEKEQLDQRISRQSLEYRRAFETRSS